MANYLSDDTDKLMSAEELSQRFKEELGIKVPVPTLNTMVTRGGGPDFYKFGRHRLYKWGTCRIWALGKLSASRGSSSEADAQQAT
jgi:hypothetical protein